MAKREQYALQFNGPLLEFTIMQIGTRGGRLQAPAGTVVAGQTYHVVGTFDGTTRRLYVNGAQVASGTLVGRRHDHHEQSPAGLLAPAGPSACTARSTRSPSTARRSAPPECRPTATPAPRPLRTPDGAFAGRRANLIGLDTAPSLPGARRSARCGDLPAPVLLAPFNGGLSVARSLVQAR